MKAASHRHQASATSSASGERQAEPGRGRGLRLCRVALVAILLAGSGAAWGSPTTLAAPPKPGAAAARDNFMVALQGELADLVNSWPGEHAVSVLDLQTDQLIS